MRTILWPDKPWMPLIVSLLGHRWCCRRVRSTRNALPRFAKTYPSYSQSTGNDISSKKVGQEKFLKKIFRQRFSWSEIYWCWWKFAYQANFLRWFFLSGYFLLTPDSKLSSFHILHFSRIESTLCLCGVIVWVHCTLTRSGGTGNDRSLINVNWLMWASLGDHN